VTHARRSGGRLWPGKSRIDKPYEEIMEDAGWKLVYSKIPEQKEDTK